MEIYALFNNEIYSCALIQGQQFDTFGDDKFKEQAAIMEQLCAHTTDWIKISEEDFQKYMQGTTGGDNGTGYIRDLQTGQCISAPPRIYSTEEKLTLIQSDFNNQLNNLKSDMSLAQLTANNDEVARLQNSYSALVEFSNNAVIEILEGEENDK